MDSCPRPTEKIKMGYRLGKRTSSLRAFVCTYLYLCQIIHRFYTFTKTIKNPWRSKKNPSGSTTCMLMPKKSSTESFKDWRPDPGLFGLPQHLSHLSGSHLGIWNFINWNFQFMKFQWNFMKFHTPKFRGVKVSISFTGDLYEGFSYKATYW